MKKPVVGMLNWQREKMKMREKVVVHNLKSGVRGQYYLIKMLVKGISCEALRVVGDVGVKMLNDDKAPP